MSDGNLEELEKFVVESYVYNMDFTKKLRPGEIIVSISSIEATNQDTVSGSSEVTVGSTSLSDSIIQVRLSAGFRYEQYKVIIIVTTNQSNTLVGEGLLRIT
jgi:hypothetical protein